MNKKFKELLRKLLLILCIIVFIASSGKLIYSFYTGYQAKNEGPKLANEVIETDNDVKYVTIDKVEINFDKLIEKNPDTIAWLQLPGTPINYPVVHRKDDNTTYLNTNFDGKHSVYGAIFLDGYNDSNLEDRVNFIFGHNVSTSITFGEKTYFTCLSDFIDKTGIDDKHTILLNTPDKKLEYTILGAIHVDEYTNLYKQKFASDEEYIEYIDNLSEALSFDRNLLNKDSKILVLSTCFEAVENTTERTLLFAYR